VVIYSIIAVKWRLSLIAAISLQDWLKGCDSNFEANIQILKVDTNETTW